MEGTRFDALSRNLSATSSRRAAVRTMTATGLALGLARLGMSKAQAGGGKGVTKRCKKSDECKGNLLCKKANSQHYYPETEKRCCIKEGQHCEDGFECCGVDVICNGGYCQSA